MPLDVEGVIVFLRLSWSTRSRRVKPEAARSVRDRMGVLIVPAQVGPGADRMVPGTRPGRWSRA
jgi:hypothetical protein